MDRLQGVDQHQLCSGPAHVTIYNRNKKIEFANLEVKCGTLQGFGVYCQLSMLYYKSQ